VVAIVDVPRSDPAPRPDSTRTTNHGARAARLADTLSLEDEQEMPCLARLTYRGFGGGPVIATRRPPEHGGEFRWTSSSTRGEVGVPHSGRDALRGSFLPFVPCAPVR